MDSMFSSDQPAHNRLPFDGEVFYFGVIMPVQRADHYLDQLRRNIAWRHDENVIFGRKIVTKRKVAWYGDQPYQYTYSGNTKTALKFTGELKELRAIAEEYSEETFNSCLLNLYHSGHEGMGWHSDAERDLKKNGAIASISLGAERRFLFKHRQTGEKVTIILEHGSLLVMKGATQTHWLHQLPLARKITDARINLTFRSIAE